MDIPALMAAAGSVKAVGELALNIAKASTQADVTAKAIELQGIISALQSSIFDAREMLFTLQEENRKLKEEAVNRENLRSDMERYALTAIRPGSVAYALKQSMGNGEPPHYVCANCYQAGKKAILTCGESRDRWFAFICPSCKSSIATGYQTSSAAKYAPETTENT